MAPIDLSIDFLEATQMVAAAEDRLKWLVEQRRKFRSDPGTYRFFDDLVQQTSRALAKLRIAAELDTEAEWAERKALMDAEQSADLGLGPRSMLAS